MKIIRFSDGLANRMFQYSCYIYLLKLGNSVTIDDSTPHYLAHDNLDWNRIFPNASYTKAPKWQCIINWGGFDIISKILRHSLKSLSLSVRMQNSFMIPSDSMLYKYNYFIGVMQNAKMTSIIKESLFKAFEFSNFEKHSYNDLLSNKLKMENSVSIHIRKGKDYSNCEVYEGTCPIEYYETAIDYIKERLVNPIFYVFTDNPKWVKQNLKTIKYNLVENNPVVGWGNHYDMQLMSYCKHNIIANSTYSWWGAFLNKNTEKIVVAPKNWFSPKKYKKSYNPDYIICEGWIAF